MDNSKTVINENTVRDETGTTHTVVKDVDSKGKHVHTEVVDVFHKDERSHKETTDVVFADGKHIHKELVAEDGVMTNVVSTSEEAKFTEKVVIDKQEGGHTTHKEEKVTVQPSPLGDGLVKTVVTDIVDDQGRHRHEESSSVKPIIETDRPGASVEGKESHITEDRDINGHHVHLEVDTATQDGVTTTRKTIVTDKDTAHGGHIHREITETEADGVKVQDVVASRTVDGSSTTEHTVTTDRDTPLGHIQTVETEKDVAGTHVHKKATTRDGRTILAEYSVVDGDKVVTAAATPNAAVKVEVEDAKEGPVTVHEEHIVVKKDGMCKDIVVQDRVDASTGVHIHDEETDKVQGNTRIHETVTTVTKGSDLAVVTTTDTIDMTTGTEVHQNTIDSESGNVCIHDKTVTTVTEDGVVTTHEHRETPVHSPANASN